MRGDDLVDFGGGDERDVARQGQHPGMPFGREHSRRRGDGAGMPVAGAAFEDARAITERQPARLPIDGDDDQPGETRGGAKRRQHVFEHGEGQCLTHLATEQRASLFLGSVPFLDRHHRPEDPSSKARTRCQNDPRQRLAVGERLHQGAVAVIGDLVFGDSPASSSSTTWS